MMISLVLDIFSSFAMMNKKTRKLAKLNGEVIIADLKPHFVHFDGLINKDSRKFLKLDTDNADYIRTGINVSAINQSIDLYHIYICITITSTRNLTGYFVLKIQPGWTDMDVNQHVSHIKLVNYVLEVEIIFNLYLFHCNFK